ncbi:MAG: hypothetical protein IKG83_07525 [Prevotella sp.]|nr:hypothetical protein [Prevotella sp.]
MKTDGVEKDTYMSLAMDIQREIEKEKKNWWAEGKAEGETNKAIEIALAMLQMNMSVEQIAKLTGLSVTQVQELHRKQ